MNDRVLVRNQPDLSIVLEILYTVATLAVSEKRSQKKIGRKKRSKGGSYHSPRLSTMCIVFTAKRRHLCASKKLSAMSVSSSARSAIL